MAPIILTKIEPFTPVLIVIITLSIITLGLPILNKFISKGSKKVFADKIDSILLKYSYHGFIDLLKSHINQKGWIFKLSFWFSALLTYFFFNVFIAICLIFLVEVENRQTFLIHVTYVFACCTWSVVIDGPSMKKTAAFNWKNLLKLKVLLSFLFQFLFIMIGAVLVYSIIIYYQTGDFLYSSSNMKNVEKNLLTEFFELLSSENQPFNYLLLFALILTVLISLIFSIFTISGTYVVLTFYTFIQYFMRKKLAKLGFVVSENDPYYLDTIISIAVFVLVSITMILIYRYSYF